LFPNNIIHLNGISITSERIQCENSWIKRKVSKMAFLENIFQIERPMACHRPPLLPDNIIHLNGISITSERIQCENSWIKRKVSKMAFLENIFQIERPMACHRPPLLPDNIIHLNGISITSERIGVKFHGLKERCQKWQFWKMIFQSKADGMPSATIGTK
jgi:hypothetical protein